MLSKEQMKNGEVNPEISNQKSVIRNKIHVCKRSIARNRCCIGHTI